ncbi:Hypothetical predicted protein, partial [Paramuricea clavata]
DSGGSDGGGGDGGGSDGGESDGGDDVGCGGSDGGGESDGCGESDDVGCGGSDGGDVGGDNDGGGDKDDGGSKSHDGDAHDGLVALIVVNITDNVNLPLDVDKRFAENGAVEFIFSSSANLRPGTAVGDTMNELQFSVRRKRIKSFQSTDSLDKWREFDAIDEGEGMELTDMKS